MSYVAGQGLGRRKWGRWGMAALGGALLLAACSEGSSKAPSDDPSDLPPHLQGCEEDYGPRQLRLLTRREYDATVKDLFPALFGEATPAGPTCATDVDCAIQTESCVGGSCVADPCELVTFFFPAEPGDHQSVHVAGSFNDWPGTEAEGGWALTYESALGAWVGKHPVASGTHQYKLVLDETTWIADPAVSTQAPDGFGGFNTEISQSCTGEEPGPGPAALGNPSEGFPVESRPEHWAFDNHAGAIVTSVHVEHYLRAARAIAERAVLDLSALDGCLPGEPDGDCLRGFVSAWGERVFRRPLIEDEVERFVAHVELEPNVAQGVSVALQIMLSSPAFLYRSEIGDPNGESAELTGHEIASLLSYGIWGTMPDPELMTAAADGRLATREGRAEQARRLLDDARARPMIALFAAQWLGVEFLTTADKHEGTFASWDEELAASMLESARRLFDHVVFSGQGSYDELLTADYAFVDERLAAFYGVEAPEDGWAKRTLPGERAGGILAHPALLATYAHSDQTSPVRRGLFVRERLLCQTLGPPPANAGAVPEIDPSATTRERFAQHSEDPGCNSCHRFIDPVGFGFERFDAVGAYRDMDAGVSIDDSGVLLDVEGLGSDTEQAFTGVGELAGILAESPAAEGCFARHAYRFVLGHEEGEGALCSVDGLEAVFIESGGDIRELIVAITQLPSFTRRK